MHSNSSKPQTPEEMLLRVIRVAEILVKSEDKSAEESPVKPPSNQADATASRVQKHSDNILV